MTTYQYTATDRNGSAQKGAIEATNIDEARGRLLERGWRVLTLQPASADLAPGVAPGPGVALGPVSDPALGPVSDRASGTSARHSPAAESILPPSPALTGEEAEELVQHVARLAASGFPLASGLRAAADECDRMRVSNALRMIAERLERGQSLTAILQNADRWLPSHIVGLIVAALRSGRLGEALLELVEHQRGTRALRSRLWQSLAYPLTVALLAAVLLGFLVIWLPSVFGHVFQEFALALPLATRQLFWWRDTGIWILAALTLLVAVFLWIYRRRVGEVRWARLMASFPFVGPLLHFRGMAEWSSLMCVLIKNHVPLPDAFRWSADGVTNAWVADRSRMWANEAAMGQRISEILSGSDFPLGLAPIVHWGEKNGVLAEAFATGREVLERRVRLRAEMLRTVLPPVLFLAIGCGVALLLVGLFSPIISLINALS